MNRYQTFMLFWLTFCLNGLSPAQQSIFPNSTFNGWKDYFDKSYGPDFELINGIQYVNPFSDSEEHPFLGDDQFYDGYAVINDRQYSGLRLKYDIYRHGVVLRYEPFPGRTDQILLNNAAIDAFYLDRKLFRKYSFSETGVAFMQVIESGDFLSYLLHEVSHDPKT